MEEIKHDSVELWAKEAEKVFKASTREMTLNEADAFTFALLNEEAWGRDLRIKKALEEKKFEVPYSCVFWNRVRLCHTYTVSVALAVFIGFLAESFGDITIYANYLQYQAYKANLKHLELGFISTLFSNGFPSREAMQQVWDAQKLRTSERGSDNMLDHSECQGSITFKD